MKIQQLMHPMAKQDKKKRISPWLQRIGTVEGYAALVFALGTWFYLLLWPIGPTLDPVELFLRDVPPLKWAIIGVALGIAGIRHGNDTARKSGWIAIGLLFPLVAYLTIRLIMKSYFA